MAATLNTALVVMGDRLGLYRALADAGPLTPAELAQRGGESGRLRRHAGIGRGELGDVSC